MSPGDETRHLIGAEVGKMADLLRKEREQAETIAKLEAEAQRQNDWRKLTMLAVGALLLALGGLWAVAAAWFGAVDRLEDLETKPGHTRPAEKGSGFWPWGD